ncbi:flagellar export protein FliJ [Pseudomonas sp. HK3]|jgi:flagellar FliJ protein
MSRERAKRLKPLVQIAQNAVNEALSYIGALQQKLNSEQEKSNTLLGYQQDYRENFQSQASVKVSGLQIQQFESFMRQIDDAITQQNNHIFQVKEQLKKAQAIYQTLNQKLKSYEKLESRLNDQAIASENQQMQKFLDEIGAQLHRLHSS